MARRWTHLEEDQYRSELSFLYVEQNKTINEIGSILNIAPQTVFDRLQRLSIPVCRDKKPFVNNKRRDIILPQTRSPELAELFGILLGGGHIDHFQVVVNLGSKELDYASHVCDIMSALFGRRPKISTRATGHRDVYLGSTLVTDWLFREGLVRNKVSAQVDAPPWLFDEEAYIQSFLRGFFDTDGSVYRLRYGIQISLTNKSLPLLSSLQKMLRTLGYAPSAMSAYRVYLTKVGDVQRFFREIGPANAKHQRRFEDFIVRVGARVVKGDAL